LSKCSGPGAACSARTYDTIFDPYSDDDRRLLFADTARRLYGSGRST
jgi:hypothetical protein